MSLNTNMITSTGVLNNIFTTLHSNKFEVSLNIADMYTVLAKRPTPLLIDELSKFCYSISGIGSGFITLYFFDHSSYDLLSILKNLKVTSIDVTQFKDSGQPARLITIPIQAIDSAVVGPLSWCDDSNKMSYISVTYSVLP